jgi:hypothetical protein
MWIEITKSELKFNYKWIETKLKVRYKFIIDYKWTFK